MKKSFTFAAKIVPLPIKLLIFMLYQDILLRETAMLPAYLQRELLDFLFFLKNKTPHYQTNIGAIAPKTKPKFGCGTVKINIAPDFKAPLEDFKEYMQ